MRRPRRVVRNRGEGVAVPATTRLCLLACCVGPKAARARTCAAPAIRLFWHISISGHWGRDALVAWFQQLHDGDQGMIRLSKKRDAPNWVGPAMLAPTPRPSILNVVAMPLPASPGRGRWGRAIPPLCGLRIRTIPACGAASAGLRPARTHPPSAAPRGGAGRACRDG